MHLVFFHESPCFGGAENYLISLVLKAIESKVNVTVVLCEAYIPVDFENKLISIGAKTVRVNFKLKNPNVFRIIPMAWCLFRDLKPDFILFNKRIDWYDFRHIILTARLVSKSRLVAVEHWHPEGWPIYPRKSFSMNLNLKKRWTKFKCKFYARCLDAIICMNNKANNIFQSQYGYPSRRLHVIYNGIDTKKFTFCAAKRDVFRRQLGLRKTFDLMVLSAGRLSNEKGIDILIDVWAMLPSSIRNRATLVVAGEGPERNALEAQAMNLNVSESIQFVGQCEDMPGLLSAADIYVAPSRRESFGLSIVEAMSIGCCVIATQVGGIPEVLGDTGVFIEAESKEGLCLALQNVITQPQFREKTAQLQNKRVRELFNLEQSMQKTLDLIKGSCNGSS